MILAIIFAPIFAVRVSIYLEVRKSEEKRRLSIFKTLMATRSRNLSMEHIDALNMVYLEFNKNNKNQNTIRDNWKTYIDHLSSQSITNESWELKRVDLFIELLYTMATYFKYGINKVDIKNLIYLPKYFYDIENDNTLIRKGIVALFSGKAALPMEVKSFPISENIEEVQQKN
jgi:hypothetical protein